MSCAISVIIPLYNTEKYIRQCLDSVFAQTFTDFEVIIVDDCSTDNGPALCRELYGHDDRMRIIRHDKNLGLGAARDTGTPYAKGRYICYVDSDDEIMPDHLGNMFSTASEYDADVLHNTRCFSPTPDENGVFPLEMLGLPEGRLISYSSDMGELTELTIVTDDLNARLDDWVNHRYHFSAWSSLYKKAFLNENNINFNNMRHTEDTVFYFQCLFKARRFIVRPGGGYIYRLGDASLSRPKNQAERLVKTMRAQLEIIGLMQRITGDMPFFRDNEDNKRRAIDPLLRSLEDGFIRLSFQALGEEKVRSEETVHSFFVENFGEKAPYVEFLFYELHRIYPPLIDYAELAKNPPEEWRQMNKK